MGTELGASALLTDDDSSLRWEATAMHTALDSLALHLGGCAERDRQNHFRLHTEINATARAALGCSVGSAAKSKACLVEKVGASPVCKLLSTDLSATTTRATTRSTEAAAVALVLAAVVDCEADTAADEGGEIAAATMHRRLK
jgi:hypothetical protein